MGINNEKYAKNYKKSKKIAKKFTIIVFSLFFIFGLTIYFTSFSGDGFIGGSGRFQNGTSINGIDVSSMSSREASNIIATTLSSKKDEIEIVLTQNDKKFKLLGKDFEVNTNILPVIEKAYLFGSKGDAFEKISKINKIKKQGFDISVSLKLVLAGFSEKLDEICQELYVAPTEPVVTFTPKQKTLFSVSDEKVGFEVNKDKLYSLIDEEFSKSEKISVEIPVEEVLPQKTKAQVESNLKLRSKFSTSYKNSIPDRKHNIKLALSKFDGMEVLPEQEVSFNEITGSRTSENGFKKANIIINGLFVEGTGGGVCQASTTLYNALIKSDLDITEVNKHSLPVSYVPLAFDAMVSEGYSDLKFKNNLDWPIYFHCYGDDSNAYVEIYGKPFDNGVNVERRAEFIKVIPHSGDRIVKDVNGEYSDKVLYKGEYYRIKKPHEGYESIAYLDYYVNGEKTDSKLLRHEIYQPQEGIVIEGVNDLGEGMTLPPNDVNIISPQLGSNSTEKSTMEKLSVQNPTKYSP